MYYDIYLTIFCIRHMHHYHWHMQQSKCNNKNVVDTPICWFVYQYVQAPIRNGNSVHSKQVTIELWRHGISHEMPSTHLDYSDRRCHGDKYEKLSLSSPSSSSSSSLSSSLSSSSSSGSSSSSPSSSPSSSLSSLSSSSSSYHSQSCTNALIYKSINLTIHL